VKTNRAFFVVVMLALTIGVSAAAHAGGAKVMGPPPLDPALMGFKESGVWYFPCTAPVYLWRIPPHYLTYAPLPPPCVPVPCPPAVTRPVKHR